MARYYASAENKENTACFLDFQLIKLSPKDTQKSKTDLRKSGQEAQSLSQKA